MESNYLKNLPNVEDSFNHFLKAANIDAGSETGQTLYNMWKEGKPPYVIVQPDDPNDKGRAYFVTGQYIPTEKTIWDSFFGQETYSDFTADTLFLYNNASIVHPTDNNIIENLDLPEWQTDMMTILNDQNPNVVPYLNMRLIDQLTAELTHNYQFNPKNMKPSSLAFVRDSLTMAHSLQHIQHGEDAYDMPGAVEYIHEELEPSMFKRIGRSIINDSFQSYVDTDYGELADSSLKTLDKNLLHPDDPFMQEYRKEFGIEDPFYDFNLSWITNKSEDENTILKLTGPVLDQVVEMDSTMVSDLRNSYELETMDYNETSFSDFLNFVLRPIDKTE